MEDDIRRVQAFLKQKYGASTLNVPLEWTEGCVSWYRYSNPGAVNTQALLNFVTEQLFLADFQQIGLRSLPPNLQRTSVISLKSSYVLQVCVGCLGFNSSCSDIDLVLKLLFVVNIGQSAYTQHCKITKGLETNDDVSADKKIPAKWEPRGKRTLLLSLTDGIQTVDALEYVPIPALHLDLIPGTKVLLKGPVECRRGVILLRQPNVELLGGEVSDLVNCNAPENVLARLIGKPENPSPVYGNYSERVAATNEPEDGETIHISSSYPLHSRRLELGSRPAIPQRTEPLARRANLAKPRHKQRSRDPRIIELFIIKLTGVPFARFGARSPRHRGRRALMRAAILAGPRLSIRSPRVGPLLFEFPARLPPSEGYLLFFQIDREAKESGRERLLAGVDLCWHD